MSLGYSDDELFDRINDFLSMCSNSFTFFDLCDYILLQAQNENMIKIDSKSWKRTVILSEEDMMRITKYLWEMIWNRNLIIDFGRQIKYNTYDIFFTVNTKKYNS